MTDISSSYKKLPICSGHMKLVRAGLFSALVNLFSGLSEPRENVQASWLALPIRPLRASALIVGEYINFLFSVMARTTRPRGRWVRQSMRLGSVSRIPLVVGPKRVQKVGFYFRFGAKDWFGKAEAGGRCTTMKPRFDPWWQPLQAAVSLS
jgi:hypothetical protein